MLIVTQKNYWGKKDVVQGTYDNITQIFNHYKNIYGGYKLEEYFSHNPYEFYRKDFNYRNYYEAGIPRLVASPPIYCMVITNENRIRYSRDYILGELRKWRKVCRNICFTWVAGYKRHHRSSYYRRPHTFQERKMSVNVLKEEGEPEWRPSRNIAGLPTNWDDLQHTDAYNNNWKRYRKTRWK